MTRDTTNNLLFATDNYFDAKKKLPSPPTDFEVHPTDINSHREFLLFPTYAKRNPADNSQWIVRAKGWALSHNSSSAKQKMMMSITKSVAGKSSADKDASLMFEERFKYFLATNKKRKDFLIKAIGTTSLEESRKYHPRQLIKPPLLEDDEEGDEEEEKLLFNLLSTRFNHIVATTTNPLSSYCENRKKQLLKALQNQYENIMPITPPTEEDEDEWTPPLSRPSNPISTVLDTDYFDSNNNNRRQSILSDEDDSHEDPIQQQQDCCGVKLKTKGSGFLSGQFLIPHDKILNWAQEQNQCDARLIRIQSVCISDHNKFYPDDNIVSLIEPIGISIISDIDDTIKDTQIKQGARTVLSKTFFEPPKGVTGMADAYMAWYSQGASFHYVSNSPFQLMPMLDRFIRESQFPPGSMHLRDDGKLISRLVETPGQAKREAILEILRDFPQRQFVLIGDSGEIDLEIYTRIAVEYPDQILKIFIRDVTTPTITELKQSISDTVRKRTRKSNATLSSLFQSKRRSQSATDFTLSTSSSSPESAEEEKKKFRTPLGIRKAVTTMFTEYAIEPHLTGHRTTIAIEGAIDDDVSEQGLLNPHHFQPKITQGEACIQLHQRVEKAKQKVASHIDIILFQDAEDLQRDTDINDALWTMWDDLSNSEITEDTSPLFSSSPTHY